MIFWGGAPPLIAHAEWLGDARVDRVLSTQSRRARAVCGDIDDLEVLDEHAVGVSLTSAQTIRERARIERSSNRWLGVGR